MQDFGDDEALEVAIIENDQREDANPLDEAKAFKRLMESESEACLNTNCLASMLREKEKTKAQTAKDTGNEVEPTAEATIREVNPHTLRIHAGTARDRFMVENLTPMVEASGTLMNRFIIFQMLHRFGYYSGNAKQVRDGIIRELCPLDFFGEGKFTGWEIYLVVMAVPEEELPALLTKVVVAVHLVNLIEYPADKVPVQKGGIKWLS